MQHKVIPFSGVTRVAPDNAAKPGELAIALNLANDGAGLAMAEEPQLLFSLENGETLIALHRGTGYTHFITATAGGENSFTLKYIDADDSNHTRTDITYTIGFPALSVLGNTLIINDNGGLRYVLWKNNAYSMLGQKPPVLDIQFSLESRWTANEPVQTGVTFKKNYTGPVHPGNIILSNDTENDDAQQAIEAINDAAFSRVNKLRADNENDGMFTQPFLVRYAYELYDGSLIMHSCPTLMVPNSKGTFCRIGISKNDAGESEIKKYEIFPHAEMFAAKLQYRLKKPDLASLGQWRDIVRRVLVFASQPFTLYDPDGKISTITVWDVESLYDNACTDLGLNGGDNDIFSWNAAVDNKLYHLITTASLDNDSATYALLNSPSDNNYNWGFDPRLDAYSRHTLFHAHITEKLKGLDTSGIDTVGKAKDVLKRIFYGYAATDESLSAQIYQLNMGYINLPENENLTKQVETCGTFYQIAEIDIDTITGATYDNDTYLTETAYLKLSCNLRTLTAQHAMTDDYLSRDNMGAAVIDNYNHRLIAAEPEYTPHTPLIPFSLWARCDKLLNSDFLNQNISYQVWLTRYWGARVYLHGDNNEDIVVGYEPVPDEHIANGWADEITAPNSMPAGAVRHSHAALPTFFFYPNPKAYKIRLFFSQKMLSTTDQSRYSECTHHYVDIALREHTALNGAFAFFGFEALADNPLTLMVQTETTTRPAIPAAGKFAFHSELIVSNADNPFAFQPANQDKIGTGTILALCPAVRPVSEGQFGYANLYVFTTEGVWTMQVNTADGTFSNIAPVTRDILMDGARPLSLDTSVVFQSERGFMLLSGSKAQCISNTLDGHSFTIPDISREINAVFGSDSPLLEAVALIATSDINTPANLAYDYANQRVYVSPADAWFSWVYNLRSATWTHSMASIDHPINAYPDCIFQQGGEAVRMVRGSRFADAVLLTRPIVFTHGALQKIRQLRIDASSFGHIATTLHATRDWKRYALIASSTSERISRYGGHPYRAHLIAALVNGDKDIAVVSATVAADNELTDKIR
ncbi:MAG: hypothetical protein IJT30_03290 [Muribaculaceae bacterium]|nr:hypothetical protein [Muribaculaceae bacterium]